MLLVRPNLTIRERLQVLPPWLPASYYQHFDLVLPGLLERLQQGRFQITNWHLFQPRADSRSVGDRLLAVFLAEIVPQARPVGDVEVSAAHIKGRGHGAVVERQFGVGDL